jgi:hypothetical protein
METDDNGRRCTTNGERHMIWNFHFCMDDGGDEEPGMYVSSFFVFN